MVNKVGKVIRAEGHNALGESPMAKPANHVPSASIASPDPEPPDPVTGTDPELGSDPVVEPG